MNHFHCKCCQCNAELMKHIYWQLTSKPYSETISNNQYSHPVILDPLDSDQLS